MTRRGKKKAKRAPIGQRVVMLPGDDGPKVFVEPERPVYLEDAHVRVQSICTRGQGWHYEVVIEHTLQATGGMGMATKRLGPFVGKTLPEIFFKIGVEVGGANLFMYAIPIVRAFGQRLS